MSQQVQIKRSVAQWHALFAAHDESGTTAAAFCRAHALCPRYFSLRRRALGWQATGGVLTTAPIATREVPAATHQGLTSNVLRTHRARTTQPAPKFVRIDVRSNTELADLSLTISAAGVTMTLSPTVARGRVLALLDALRAS